MTYKHMELLLKAIAILMLMNVSYFIYTTMNVGFQPTWLSFVELIWKYIMALTAIVFWSLGNKFKK